MKGVSLVTRANQATTVQLAKSLQTSVCLNGRTFQICVKQTAQLTSEEYAAIWHMTETNMRVFLEKSSLGWDEVTKKQELFHPTESRFILVKYQPPDAEAGGQQQPAAGPAFAAFTVFRFEEEFNERLLYCYELQIAEPWRRYGVGRSLMTMLIDIGRHWRMQKLMLTVLKANEGARKFYSAIGLEKDESTPDYVPEGETAEDIEECDYDIMSLML
ncbi:hypothetical protein BDW22DRAFT_1350681 [Trametopsis cervina]|nr:hypothetical protein BDW22DRAFT_1350681 [Trametopsis cervina]